MIEYRVIVFVVFILSCNTSNSDVPISFHVTISDSVRKTVLVRTITVDTNTVGKYIFILYTNKDAHAFISINSIRVAEKSVAATFDDPALIILDASSN